MSNKYKVQILVDSKPIKEYSKDNKIFVEAKLGTEYSVRIKNNSDKRALAIISVDGINIITGKIANPTDTGYVISAWSSIEIEGYRKDSNGGGRFKFTEKESGYSKEIDGTGINSGVIGVLLVEELVIPQVPHYEFYKDSDLYKEPKPWQDGPDYWDTHTWISSNGKPYIRSLCKSFATNNQANDNVNPDFDAAAVNYCSTISQDSPKATLKFDTATTWGSEFNQKVTYTDFTRSSNTETIEIFYASRSALKAMNIINDNPPALNFPQSFPGFAKPPTSWKG